MHRVNPPPITRSLLIFAALAAAFVHPAAPRRPKPPKPSAAFVSQSVPTAMTAGQSYNVSVTMQNNGLIDWPAGRVQLGSQSPKNNVRWGTKRIALPNDVAQGASVTFSFNVVAPAKPGSYNFQWRMVQGTTWFGAATSNVAVVIGTGAPTPSPTVTPTPSPAATPIPTATPTPTPSLGRATVYIAHLRA